jgi:hypothetical protein
MNKKIKYDNGKTSKQRFSRLHKKAINKQTMQNVMFSYDLFLSNKTKDRINDRQTKLEKVSANPVFAYTFIIGDKQYIMGNKNHNCNLLVFNGKTDKIHIDKNSINVLI